jgi:hypothetical protein
MKTFTLVPRGAFSLAASIKFLEGFTPAAYTGSADAVLELAFPVEGSWQTVGVRVRQDSAGAGWPGASQNGSGRWRMPPWTASSTRPGCGPCRTRKRWPT